MGEFSAVEESSACAEAAARYRGKFEWPCTAHGHAVWTLAGQAVDAVDLPDGLVPAAGRRGVIEVPGETWYLRFLLRPSRSTPPAVLRRLDRLGARYLGQGVPIELPPTRVPGGALRWIHEPDGAVSTLSELLTSTLLSEHKSSER